MNFSWSHPVTGLRCNADTEAQAKYEAWHQLKTAIEDPDHPDIKSPVTVYRQEPAGQWTPGAGVKVETRSDSDGYSWLEAGTGKRVSYNTAHPDPREIQALIENALKAANDEGFTTSVAIHHQFAAFNVFHFEPEPPIPADPDPPAPAVSIEPLERIGQLIAEVESIAVDLHSSSHPFEAMQRAFTLATLYRTQHYMERRRPRRRSHFRRVAEHAAATSDTPQEQTASELHQKFFQLTVFDLLKLGYWECRRCGLLNPPISNNCPCYTSEQNTATKPTTPQKQTASELSNFARFMGMSVQEILKVLQADARALVHSFATYANITDTEAVERLVKLTATSDNAAATGTEPIQPETASELNPEGLQLRGTVNSVLPDSQDQEKKAE